MDWYGRDKESICPRPKMFQFMELYFCTIKQCILNIILRNTEKGQKNRTPRKIMFFTIIFFSIHGDIH